jgi:restriction system protein
LWRIWKQGWKALGLCWGCWGSNFQNNCQKMPNKIPDFQKIMFPLLNFLGDGQAHALSDVMDSMTKYFKLSEGDLRIKVPSGQMGLFKNRVAWAISYLKNAGLIFYPKRAVYQVTEVGKKALGENIDYINIAYLKKFEGYKKWQNTFAPSGDESKEKTSPADEKTPEEILGDTIIAINNKVSYDLLDTLLNKSYDYFELFVLKLLNKMGYGGTDEDSFEAVGKSGDNGIDGIIYQDKLGIDSVYVQAKRWKDNKVQSKDIRDFIGALNLKGTSKGIFITTSDFTADAVKTGSLNPQNKIILINGKQLADFAMKYNVGVQIRKTYEVKDVDADFFEEL